MSAATQIYYTPFDSAFFKLPPEVRARIEAKVDEMGLRLKTFPHQRLTGHSVKVGVLVHPVPCSRGGTKGGSVRPCRINAELRTRMPRPRSLEFRVYAAGRQG